MEDFKDWICCRPPRSHPVAASRRPNCTEEFELLLLGTDGSGKSTFLRQMKIIHDRGFNDDELADFKPDVYRNLTDAMAVLVTQATRLELELSYSQAVEDSRVTSDPESTTASRLAAVSRLWADESIRTCYKRRAEYSTTHPINVSAEYFLDEVERISEPSYLPITEDIIRMRRGTQGISTHDFRVPNGRDEVLFRITDVGGESAERERWVYQIERLSNKLICVIFLAAIDEFDTNFIEDEVERNRLKKSVELFSEIRSFRWMSATSFILFLNKVDVFKEKIKTINIVDHFENFNDHGFPKDYESGVKFVKSLYLPRETRKSRSRVFTHETTATDTSQMKRIFSSVKETILTIYLQGIGMD